MTGEKLPPELRAAQAAMDSIFGVGQPFAQISVKQIEIESAIMTLRGFDYLTFSELLAALTARLESRYEDRLDEKVADLVKQLDQALAQAEEPEDDPKWDEDQIADDPRRL